MSLNVDSKLTTEDIIRKIRTKLEDLAGSNDGSELLANALFHIKDQR